MGSAGLWEFAPAARRWLAGSIALSTAGSLAGAALLVGVALIVAAVFGGTARAGDVAPALAVLAGIVLLRAVLVGSAEGTAQHAAALVTEAQRQRVTAFLRARHPVAGLDRRSGELVHLVSGDVERLDGYVARYLPARATAGAVPILVAALITVIDPLTLPILLFTGPLLVITLALIGRTTQARAQRRERELAWLDGHFLDMIRGLPTLRLFGRSKEQAATIDAVTHRLARSSLDVLRTAFQTSLVLEWGATAATALVAIAVSVRLMAGDLAFDRALAVLLLTPECFLPVRRLAAQYHVGAAGKTALAALSAVGEAETEPQAVPALSEPPPFVAAPALRVRDLTVRYEGRDRPALDRVSFEADANRLTVIAGESGAGKSTLVAVLLRFIEVTGGSVEADGFDVASLDATAWRRCVAWLPQQPHLFDGSVEENVRLGRPAASDTEVRTALRAAAADAFVDALPNRAASAIGEGGARLSGGEVARIALARALLREAPVLVVDEPTAHLDGETAAAVRSALLDARRTSTVLAISHDPELAAVADRVVTLEAGRVVEVRSAGPAGRRASGRRQATPVAWTAGPPGRIRRADQP
jgi:thiol reductant ABC exporter CydD subunit